MCRKTAIIVLIIITASCAYFNTFYNAQKLFREARELPLKDDGKPSPNAVQKYNNAIKKCGLILTEYKDSKYADDALFLLAKCFYHTGTNYLQSIEKIDDLLKFYPESEFVPEALLYLAMAKYEFNRKNEAHENLQEFINNPAFSKYHPQALRIIADYYLKERNFPQAQSNFKTIISKYPKSEEYQYAFFASGKTYHESRNYQKSNETFFSLLKAKVSKKTKLDARYYIILNYLNLKEYDKALDNAVTLMKLEYRIDILPRIQLLKARCLTGLNQIEESIALFETVITANQNTAISAEASYYLAELYFITLQDYEKAIEYYNNVKKEYNRSEFVEDSVSRSSVASQILQYNNPDYTIPVEDLVNQQFKLAEFYIEVLDNPDSALAVYNNIILQEHLLKDRLDSLRYVLANFSEPDYPVYIEDIQPDSLTIFIDSLDTVADTVKTLSREDITNQISRLENSIIQYKNDFIPMAHFIKIWLYVNSYQDTTSAYQEFTVLKSESPQSRYTFASDRLLQGEQAELITYTQKKNREEYENAISWLERDPIIALSKLDSIITQSQHEYFNKALYTAGYISYFLLADTTRARDYLDNLLANRPEQEMVQAVNKFYNDGDFIALSRVELLSDEKTVPEIPDTTKDQKPEEKVLPVPETKEELAEPEKELLLEADEPVEILKREKMIIPDFFKRDFEVIDIELAVDKEGKLNALSIINPAAADSTLLRRILQNNIQKWQFKPAQKDGEPVDAKLLLPLDLSNE